MEQTYQGMLDEFAGRAMQMLMRQCPVAPMDDLAEWSYDMALAMMKERARRQAEMDKKAPPPHGSTPTPR